MATTVNIPQEELAELMRLTGAATKKDAVNFAVTRTLQLLRQNEAIDKVLAMGGDLLLSPEEAEARHRALSGD
ncbi:type II toxin-antitoxin system VapB family antitoxin [Tsukamurella soli]|uniref:Antitoxin of type II TA system, VapB n=1 Tax=Tsukamurella soli TaxID=644556 RepID=A0ABP8JWC9_9ACTN